MTSPNAYTPMNFLKEHEERSLLIFFDPVKMYYVGFYSSSLKLGFMEKNSNISLIYSKMVSPNTKLHKTVLIEHKKRIPAVYSIPIFILGLKIQYVDF